MARPVKIKGKLRSCIQLLLIMGIILAVVNAGMYILSPMAGIVITVFVLLYFLLLVLMLIHSRSLILNELINFATQYGQVQRQLLRNLELPYALLDDSGKVVWTNEAFEQLVHREKGYKRSITTLFPDITREKLPVEVNETEFEMHYEEYFFMVRMKKISLTDMLRNSDVVLERSLENYLVAMYLFDETALKIALQENDDQSLAVGLIYLDNYEEALESVEQVRRSLLTALIERKINKYIAAFDGIVKPIEKDKYMVVLRKKSVTAIQELKFDLLEDVKRVNIGNEMAVTLSIGIGLDGLSYSQNYEFARTAIDLALARGGDQSVVKTPDKVTYYGGKSQQVEKSTRVKARVKAHALKEIISSKDKVFVMGHRNPDVDSFGAAVGIRTIANSLGRKTHIVLNDVSSSLKPLVDSIRQLPDYEEDSILTSEEAMQVVGSNAVLVVVDVNKPSITDCPELLKLCKSIVVLDHHRQGLETIENATLSYVEPYASSSCEMVAEVLQYVDDDVKIKNIEADCLYSGMMIDTNNFMSKTGVRTFEAAAFLRRNGADVTRVRKMFRENVDDYKAKAEAVRIAEVYRDMYAISISPSQGVESPTVIAAQAANELLNITGIKASFVLTDYQGQIYISARSIDEVNVQIIMERLGGGGHMNIAGAQIQNSTLESVRQLLKDTLDTMIKEGDI